MLTIRQRTGSWRRGRTRINVWLRVGLSASPVRVVPAAVAPSTVPEACQGLDLRSTVSFGGVVIRSEERRVGKEGISRRARGQLMEKMQGGHRGLVSEAEREQLGR